LTITNQTLRTQREDKYFEKSEKGEHAGSSLRWVRQRGMVLSKFIEGDLNKKMWIFILKPHKSDSLKKALDFPQG